MKGRNLAKLESAVNLNSTQKGLSASKIRRIFEATPDSWGKMRVKAEFRSRIEREEGSLAGAVAAIRRGN
jgi:hypothetical protein